jgi:hypothetical protein
MKDRREKRQARRSIMAITALAFVAGAAVCLLGGENSQTVQAHSGATTGTAAAAAGARVLPTDPQLKVELVAR